MKNTETVQHLSPIYSIARDAGGKTWGVSDQFCVLIAGCDSKADAERIKSLLATLYLERKETERIAAQKNDLLTALKHTLCYLEKDADDEQERLDYAEAATAIIKAEV